MNTEQLEQLKAMVTEAEDLPEGVKVQLLELLGRKASAVNFDERTGTEGHLLSSVEEFEVAHPEATSFMGRLATTLANMGI